MKRIKLVYCDKCGLVKSAKRKCSNCMDIELLKQGKKRRGEEKIERRKEKQRQLQKRGKKRKNKNKLVFRKRGDAESISSYYKAYIKSSCWFQKRAIILKKNNGLCEICGEKAENVHHWHYNNLLGTEPNKFLSPLCKACHCLIHEDLSDMLKKIKYSKRKNFEKKKQKVIDEVIAMTSVFELDQEYFDIVRNS